jgi:hypothetical protein
MAIIPADRITTWAVGTNLGVEGGIPSNRTEGEIADAATYGDGVTDATDHILAKMAATGADEYCYLPAGTYRCVDRLLFSPSSKTLRGAGPGLTILQFVNGDDGLYVGPSEWPRPDTAVAITAGATVGSDRITLTSTTGFSAGQLVRIQNTGLDYVVLAHDSYPDAVQYDPKRLSFMHIITAVDGSDLVIKPDLAHNFTGAEAVKYAQGPVNRFGIEDLTIDANGTGDPVFMQQTTNCWIKNVEIKNSPHYGLRLLNSVFFEVRKLHLHQRSGEFGTSTEGIMFNNDVSWSLIEDCVINDGGFPGICFGNGGSSGCVSGCVVGYVLSTDAFYPGSPRPFCPAISLNHGPHNSFNLVEGCIMDALLVDGYNGSASHNTVHRCWVSVLHPNSGSQNGVGFTLARWSTYHNITGNIIGDTTFNGATQVGIRLGYPQFANGTYTSGNTWGPQTPPTYRLQYTNGSIDDLDANVEETLIRHGNYEYTGASGSQVWDGGIADHDLPQSLYTTKADLIARGVAFTTFDFPPIDPANPPGAYNDSAVESLTPAGYRYVNGEDPPETVPYSVGRLRCMIL